ncbi:MAG: glucosaminidase domain-containing protein [Saprospiraceae bacterium]|nr:glucosaminidase domain-containing protein [Saprospiraceae bacterium]
MNKQYVTFSKDLKKEPKVVRRRLNEKVRRHWPKLLVLVTLAYIIYRKDVSIDLYLNGMQADVIFEAPENISFQTDSKESPVSQSAMNVSLLENEKITETRPVASKDNLANTYSNMTYTEGVFATKDSEGARIAKRRKQEAYVKRFANTAQAERDKFGIPASIILAQGLLESDAGDSRLATQNRNHFGMKCFSRSCKKGHCSNYTDDSHKDFFRIYKNDWESYRAHSYLLQADRYRNLFKLDKKDYKNWALGLKKAGYATDKHYGEKLINLIEDLKLYAYD